MAKVKTSLVVAALAMLLAPAAARADFLFTPQIGASFGGDSNGEHLTYGASIGWMGAGIFGIEGEFAYTPEYFEDDDDGGLSLIDSSNVTSFMVNALVGIPIGGQAGGGVRPYVSGGVGVIQSNVEDTSGLFDVDSSEFGVNVGAGVMVFMADHIGVRGDVRYYRALTDPDTDDGFDIDLADFDFWRATAGVTFRW